MKTVLALLALFALQTSPSVREAGGDIEYVGADGGTRALTCDHRNGEAVLSPDGKTVAFIRTDDPGGDGRDKQTSLWIANGPAGTARQLVAPRPSEDMKRIFLNVHRPIFSLDGRALFVEAQAWTTSEAVHRVDIATGKTRYVIDGWLVGMIRTGRYAGHLLVGRHKYHGPPNYGSYNPVYLVRQDGKPALMIPGSDKDDGEKSVEAWLAAQGTTLS